MHTRQRKPCLPAKRPRSTLRGGPARVITTSARRRGERDTHQFSRNQHQRTPTNPSRSSQPITQVPSDACKTTSTAQGREQQPTQQRSTTHRDHQVPLPLTIHGPCFNRGPFKQSKTKRSQAINNEHPKGLPTTTHQLSRNQHQRPHTSPSRPTTTPLHGTSIMPSTSARDQGGEQRASPAVKTCPQSLPSTLPQSDIQCHAPLIGRKVTSIISYL